MKKCFKCLKEKPISEFYKHSAMADGHLNKCKDCAKSDVKARYNSCPDVIKAYERSRANAPHRVAARAAYSTTPEGKAALQRGKKKYSDQNPDKRAAHTLLRSSIRCGKISKPLHCATCGGGGKIHGHHSDYTKPLDVEWLCSKCHSDLHKKQRMDVTV